MNDEMIATLSAQEAAIARGSQVLHPGVTDRVLRFFDAIRSSGAPRVALQRAIYFTESFKTTEGQPLVWRWAKALNRPRRAVRGAQAVESNVRSTVRTILESPEGQARLAEGRAKILGAIYEIETGRVRVLGPTETASQAPGPTRARRQGCARTDRQEDGPE